MRSLSLLNVELFSVAAEIFFFGAFSILCPIAIWILVYRQRRRRRSSSYLWLTAIVTAMFVCAGAYLALDFYHLLSAFVGHNATPGGPLAFYDSPVNDPSPQISAAIFAFLTLLGDGFMAYRVFVVWDRKLISLVFPGVLVVGDLVTTSLAAKVLLQPGPTSQIAIFTPGGRPTLTAYFVMTLVTNLGITFLLLGRLWWHDRRTKRHLSQRPYNTAPWRVMKTIVQSQALYSAGVIFNLVTFLANSKLALVTIAILPPLIGISFTLIIARIGLDEVLGSTPNQSSADSHDIELNNRGPAPTPIAVRVHISQSDDGADVAADDHTKSATIT